MMATFACSLPRPVLSCCAVMRPSANPSAPSGATFLYRRPLLRLPPGSSMHSCHGAWRLARPQGVVPALSGSGGSGGGQDGGSGGSGSGGGGSGGGGGDSSGGGGASEGAHNRGGGGAFFLLLASAFALLPTVGRKLYDLVAAIPTPVLTPFLMAMASLLAAILTVWNQRVLSEQGKSDAALEAARQRRERDLADRQRMFQRYAEPMGQAAGGLQSKLFKIHEGTMPDRDQEGVEYTAFELGTFLGLLHVLREMSPSLSFGNPGRDAVRRSLLRDIEDGLAWDISELLKVSTYIAREQEWQRSHAEDAGGDYDPGVAASSATEHMDILHIPRSKQTLMGDLMLRERWVGTTTCFGKITADDDNADYSTAAHKLILFADFQGLLRTNQQFKTLWQPILDDINLIMPKECSRGSCKPDSDRSTALVDCPRVRILQAMLLDLLDFVDPKPFCRVVSAFDRKSILARISSQENPPFMRRLSMANEADRLKIRLGEAYNDQVGSSYAETCAELETWQGRFYRFRRRQKGLPEWQVVSDSDQIPQVMVKMGEDGQPSLDPFSHRVVATLEHRGIPYCLVPVSLNPKPRWLHQVSRGHQVPVMFHEGSVLNQSDLILQYINFTWPHKTSPNGTRPFASTQFMQHTLALFQASDWVEFDETKGQVMKSLQKTQAIVQQADADYLSGPALGDADLALAPVLHQCLFALENHFGEDLSEFEALKAYRARCLSHPALRSTAPHDAGLETAFRMFAEMAEAEKRGKST